ncbi:hypothetical protein [Deinococcus sonorensis]|uniref:Uncharacterized protein n=2 Tax=Deinococcus sonorensis TaxID=309891 RepID=A0AAU7UGN4_9DEIO
MTIRTRRYRQPTEVDLAVEDLPRVERRARTAITTALTAELELEMRLLSSPDGRAERWAMLAEAMQRAAEPSGWRVEGPNYGQSLIEAHNRFGGYLDLRLVDGELMLISGWSGGGVLGRHVFELAPGVAEALAGQQ